MIVARLIIIATCRKEIFETVRQWVYLVPWTRRDFGLLGSKFAGLHK